MRARALHITFLLIISFLYTSGQKTIQVGNRSITYDYIENNGDTIINFYIREVIVFPVKTGTKKEAREYQKLVRNIKKVYPYAKLAKIKLIQINDTLLTKHTEHERKLYIKKVDRMLQDQFGDDLKKLTITQGRLLLKLIDRETGNTSYEIVKELRGTFSAFFWQSLALLFGTNMKSKYDPAGEDKLIEQIIVQIDNGQI
ncbi:MAG: DUF4294 domain-containing protein [Bacteroidia bacterium]|nr:DUF4294 domain-containing protein [Bacteroidia bacterium]